MIEVDRLTRTYGATVALDRISFQVRAGEIVGFLGPNGAGKSTAMKILTGSLAPTAGSARLAGYDIQDDADAVRRQIGFMPEQVPLYPDDTVDDFLNFVAALKGVTGPDRRRHLAEVVERAGLGEVRQRTVGHLSKGFRQRVGLGQALVGDPPILILDEPSSGLDPHQIVEIRELIRGFRGEKTVLLSSHILGEVDRICGRVLILDRGRIVSEQHPDQLAAQRQRRIGLAWDGARETVLAALAGVAGVTDITATADGAEVTVTTEPAEVRPLLVEALIAAGGRLQRCEDLGASLEELFLQLTRSDRPPPTAGDRSTGDRPQERP